MISLVCSQLLSVVFLVYNEGLVLYWFEEKNLTLVLHYIRSILAFFFYCFLCVDQISSARDISRSSIEDFSGNSSSERLLRLTLTDGHSEVTAIEYTHIPAISNDVVPGTKVCLFSCLTCNVYHDYDCFV